MKNGQITNTFLGEHEGFWFLELKIEFDGCGISHRISLYDTEKIIELFNMLEVTEYEEIKGCYVRVNVDGLKTYGIGHIIKDKWVNWK